MHKVRNLRDFNEIERQPKGDLWRLYCIDLDKLFDKAVQGGYGNLHANSNTYEHNAA